MAMVWVTLAAIINVIVSIFVGVYVVCLVTEGAKDDELGRRLSRPAGNLSVGWMIVTTLFPIFFPSGQFSNLLVILSSYMVLYIINMATYRYYESKRYREKSKPT